MRYEPEVKWQGVHGAGMAYSGRLEADAAKAQRAPDRRLLKRLVEDGSTRYVAYDAHQLLESESDIYNARPGHPLG